MTTELQRIAKALKININSENLCLLIQDKIRKQYKDVKKNEFCNVMLKEQIKKYEKQIHNLKNEFAESIGIQEHMLIKQSRDIYKKNNKKLLEDNYKLRNSIEQYRENELKDKIKKIEGVR